MRTRSTARRVIAAFAGVLLAGSMAACGNSDTGGDSGDGNDKIVLGFSQVGAESGWRTANTTSIKEAAAAAGIELKFDDAQQKQENQIKAIRAVRRQMGVVSGWAGVGES
ncbi:LacI family transcriptional regulator, partial [Micromonospora chalcea]